MAHSGFSKMCAFSFEEGRFSYTCFSSDKTGMSYLQKWRDDACFAKTHTLLGVSHCVQMSSDYELRHQSWEQRRMSVQSGRRERCVRHLPCREWSTLKGRWPGRGVITSHHCSSFPLAVLESWRSLEGTETGDQEIRKICCLG